MTRKRFFSTAFISLKYNILFFGSDEFSLTCLKELVKNNHLIKNLQVISAQNSVSSLPKFTHLENIPTFRAPPKTLKGWDIPSGNYDFGVVVSFGYFLPKRILQRFQGTLNVHPSLLPK